MGDVCHPTLEQRQKEGWLLQRKEQWKEEKDRELTLGMETLSALERRLLDLGAGAETPRRWERGPGPLLAPATATANAADAATAAAAATAAVTATATSTATAAATSTTAATAAAA